MKIEVIEGKDTFVFAMRKDGQSKLMVCNNISDEFLMHATIELEQLIKKFEKCVGAVDIDEIPEEVTTDEELDGDEEEPREKKKEQLNLVDFQ